MSVLHLFSRSRVERSGGYLDIDVKSASSSPSTASSSNDVASLGTQRVSSRPRTPATAKQRQSAFMGPTAPPEQLNDLSQPPPFKKIFQLSVLVAPALTCAVVKSYALPKTLPATGFDAPSKRISRAPLPPESPELSRKIFSLTKNGYVLQYSDRGPTDRAPERVQRLTPDTVAIASDFIPGRPYTVLIADSANLDELSRPDPSSLLSKFGLKHGPAKRAIPSTLIVLDSAPHLEEWLSFVRSEVTRLSKEWSQPGQVILQPYVRNGLDNGAKSALEQPSKETEASAVDDRADSPRQSYTRPRDAAVLGSANPPSRLLTQASLHKPLPELNRPEDGLRASPSKSRAVNDTALAPSSYSSPITPQSTIVRDRKDSLANSIGSPLLNLEPQPTAKIRKRASQYVAATTKVEAPQLRTATSLGRLRVPVETVTAPVPSLAPEPTYADEPTLPSDYNETSRMENDEYHAFQQSLCKSPTHETDEYHAFQQSLSADARRRRRPSTGKRRRFSALPASANPTGRSSPPFTSPPPAEPPVLERPFIPPTSQSTSRPGTTHSGAIPIALAVRPATAHAPPTTSSVPNKPTGRRRRLHRPESMTFPPSAPPPPPTPQPQELHIQATGPQLHGARSEQYLRPTVLGRSVTQPVLVVASDRYEESDDEEGDLILIQTNVEPGTRGRLVPMGMGPPPSAPLPRLPGRW